LGAAGISYDAWSQQPAAPQTFVVGHRGLLDAAPENTLAGFRACLALRIGFEFDVQRAKGGELVCVHDATVERTTSGQGRVSELSLAELSRLDAGSWFAASFRGERIPTVVEIIALIAREGSAATLIAVDLKDHGEGLEAEVVKLAVEHKVLNRLVFIGATIESAEIRARLKEADATAQIARLAKTPEEIDTVVEDEQASWVYVRFLPTRAQVKRIRTSGKRIFLAGPLVAGEKTENWKMAAEYGIDGVLTDYPLELAQELRAPDRPAK
jgi:glycerophosphoryl diester phosphodiesterase